jgi:hypothetical protein
MVGPVFYYQDCLWNQKGINILKASFPMHNLFVVPKHTKLHSKTLLPICNIHFDQICNKTHLYCPFIHCEGSYPKIYGTTQMAGNDEKTMYVQNKLMHTPPVPFVDKLGGEQEYSQLKVIMAMKITCTSVSEKHTA